MPLALDESLAKLCRLSPAALHRTSRRVRADLGSAEWKLAVCLLASVRTSSYRILGYANISQYAERSLQVSGKKTRALLGVARALEHLPLLSEAFQSGKLEWAKLRAIQSLATPETEKAWLDFAMSHRTDEVVSMVTLSPSAWKKQQALAASLEGKPLATVEEVEGLLGGPMPATECGEDVASPDIPPTEGESRRPAVDGCTTGTGDARHAGDESEQAPAPAGPCPLPGGRPQPPRLVPKTIQLVFSLTPEQFARYERAEGRVRARLGKRVSRVRVLDELAGAYLEGGTARSRAKHQMVILKLDGDDHGWYLTERGLFPVEPSVLAQAERSRTGRSESPRLPQPGEAVSQVSASPGPDKSAEAGHQRCDGKSTSPCRQQQADGKTVALADPTAGVDASGPTQARKPSAADWKSARRPVPVAVLRELFARAGHRCEDCGDTGPLEVHHKQPVSDGGGNELESLGLRCRACHRFEHEADFANRPGWRQARERTLRERARRGSDQAGERRERAVPESSSSQEHPRAREQSTGPGPREPSGKGEDGARGLIPEELAAPKRTLDDPARPGVPAAVGANLVRRRPVSERIS